MPRAAVRAHVHDHYDEQVRLYALAVVKLLGLSTYEHHGARFGGILYVFLRGLDAEGRGVWSSRPAWDEVLAWDGALRARRFAGGPS